MGEGFQVLAKSNRRRGKVIGSQQYTKTQPMAQSLKGDVEAIVLLYYFKIDIRVFHGI